MKKYSKYYAYDPRNFLNEFIIFCVKPEHAEQFEIFRENAQNNPNSGVYQIYAAAAKKRNEIMRDFDPDIWG